MSSIYKVLGMAILYHFNWGYSVNITKLAN
mgnify:CR=1 FL=1